MAACLRHDPLQLHQEIRQDHAQRCFDLGDSLKRQPTKFLIYANDLEQTLARVFKTMEGIIQHNPELQREAEVQSRTIYLSQRHHGHSDQRRLCRRRWFQSWLFFMG
jgi:hypothetical protein